MELTTLSWMLIAADRASEVGIFFFFFLLVLVVTAGLRALFMHDEMSEGCKYYGSKLVPRWAVVLTVLFSIPFLLALSVPSSTVIMQVAAIELGDDVLTPFLGEHNREIVFRRRVLRIHGFIGRRQYILEVLVVEGVGHVVLAGNHNQGAAALLDKITQDGLMFICELCGGDVA